MKQAVYSILSKRPLVAPSLWACVVGSLPVSTWGIQDEVVNDSFGMVLPRLRTTSLAGVLQKSPGGCERPPAASWAKPALSVRHCTGDYASMGHNLCSHLWGRQGVLRAHSDQKFVPCPALNMPTGRSSWRLPIVWQGRRTRTVSAHLVPQTAQVCL